MKHVLQFLISLSLVLHSISDATAGASGFCRSALFQLGVMDQPPSFWAERLKEAEQKDDLALGEQALAHILKIRFKEIGLQFRIADVERLIKRNLSYQDQRQMFKALKNPSLSNIRQARIPKFILREILWALGPFALRFLREITAATFDKNKIEGLYNPDTPGLADASASDLQETLGISPSPFIFKILNLWTEDPKNQLENKIDRRAAKNTARSALIASLIYSLNLHPLQIPYARETSPIQISQTQMIETLNDNSLIELKNVGVLYLGTRTENILERDAKELLERKSLTYEEAVAHNWEEYKEILRVKFRDADTVVIVADTSSVTLHAFGSTYSNNGPRIDFAGLNSKTKIVLLGNESGKNSRMLENLSTSILPSTEIIFAPTETIQKDVPNTWYYADDMTIHSWKDAAWREGELLLGSLSFPLIIGKHMDNAMKYNPPNNIRSEPGPGIRVFTNNKASGIIPINEEGALSKNEE